MLILVYNLMNQLILWDRGSPCTSGQFGTCYADWDGLELTESAAIKGVDHHT